MRNRDLGRHFASTLASVVLIFIFVKWLSKSFFSTGGQSKWEAPERRHKNRPRGQSIHWRAAEGWHPEEREHHRKEQLYWRLTAFLTLLAVVGAVGTLVLSEFGLQEARKATLEARRQADAADRSNRPWIQVSGITLGFAEIRDNDRVWIGLRAAIVNSGNTTAQDVYIVSTFTLEGAINSYETNFSNYLCKDKSASNFPERAVLPNLGTVFIQTPSVAIENLKKRFFRLPPDYYIIQSNLKGTSGLRI